VACAINPDPTARVGGLSGSIVALPLSRSSQTQMASRSAASTPLDRWLAGVAGSGGSPASSRAPQRGSQNQVKAARVLAREHVRVANVRRNFLHEVSSQLAKTHSKLAVEDLPVANLIRNKRLAKAIADAAWAEFARQLRYKTAWLGGELVVCNRWFPSTRTCSACGSVAEQMTLGTRTFRCGGCGLVMDRDCNAAANLAAWAERARALDRQAGGQVTNAPGGEGAGHRFSGGETGPSERGTDGLSAR
jgi:putative transposase